MNRPSFPVGATVTTTRPIPSPSTPRLTVPNTSIDFVSTFFVWQSHLYRNFGRYGRFLYRPYRVSRRLGGYGTVTVSTVTVCDRIFYGRNRNGTAHSPRESENGGLSKSMDEGSEGRFMGVSPEEGSVFLR